MSEDRPKANANGDAFLWDPEAVRQRIRRMQAEAPTYQAPRGILAPWARAALGRVDYVALAPRIIDVQLRPLASPMVCHNEAVAAASMAAEIARIEMKEGDVLEVDVVLTQAPEPIEDLRVRGSVTAAGAQVAEALEAFSEQLDRTIDALGPAEGWTTHPDGSRSFHDDALSDAISAAVDRALLATFEGVQPGVEGYFWFEEDCADGAEKRVVRRVVRDGSGGLWTDEGGHGVRVTQGLAARCLGPVAPVDLARIQAARANANGDAFPLDFDDIDRHWPSVVGRGRRHVDTVAVAHKVIDIQVWPPAQPMVTEQTLADMMVRHNEMVAAASMAAEIARGEMDAKHSGVTPAGVEVATILEAFSEALDRTIEALDPGADPDPVVAELAAKRAWFDGVRPGRPGYFWFQFHPPLHVQDPQPEVCRVVRDGSGGLWIDVDGQAEALREGHLCACVGPVAPYKRGKDGG